MSLELYSDILTIATVLVAIGTLSWLAITFVNPVAAQYSRTIGYRAYLILSGLLAFIATVSALLYQYAYGLPVCELCWWQRIFMFPIEIVAVTGIFTRSNRHHIAIAALCVLGIPFALYHYSLHLREMVFHLTVSAPCSAIGLSPSCSASHVLSFGYMTIPGMALLVFISIFVLSVLAARAEKADTVE